MRKGSMRVPAGRAVAIVCAVLLAAATGSARADEIVVGGDTIHGKVVGVTGSKVDVALPYGKDVKVSIPVENITSLTTDEEFVFGTSDGPETRGRILGIRDGAFLVGESASGATAVPKGDIALVTSQKLLEESTLARVKNALRFWDANLDVGVGYSQGTVDSTTFSLVGQARRSKGPFRLLFDAGWWYGTQKKLGDTQTTLADRVFGAMRAEYDLTPRLYAYGNGSVEYNGVQRLSIRGIPEAGLGYKIWKSSEKNSKDFLAGTLGAAWVYESYFGYCDGDAIDPPDPRCGIGAFSAPFHNDFFSVAFGLEWFYTLPYAGATLDGRLQYLPSVSDFTHDYLLKTDLGISVPVWKQVALRFSLSDVYDGTPAPGTTYNYLITNFGVSLFL